VQDLSWLALSFATTGHQPGCHPPRDKVLLRAERAGTGNGRVYQVSFFADDGRGGTCTGTGGVTVPTA